MPVTAWRRPVLAPVYALVTAFVTVMGANLATASSPTVTIVASGDVQQLVDHATFNVGDRQQAYKVEPNRKIKLADDVTHVCLQLPEPWRVVEPLPTDGCVDRAGGDSLKVTVARAKRVHVVADGPLPQGVTVTLEDAKDSTRSETGPLGADGYYLPRSAISGQRVCVSAFGWTTTDRQRCQNPVQDKAGDAEIRLVKQ